LKKQEDKLKFRAMEKKGTAKEENKKNKYSNEELKEFKELIQSKLEKATKDLDLLTEAYTNHDDHGTNDTSPTFKVLEEGHNVLSKEENSRLAARQQKFINNLENALIRIENKTYGICRVTGKLISKERLRSVPHATLSMEAKLNQ
jgi:RNA polymerase-binding transcription factor DksA